MYVVVGGEDLNLQLSLRDETIYHLKQEIVSLKDSTISIVKALISENKQLRSQLSIKEGGVVYLHSFLFACDLRGVCHQLERSHLP